VPPIQYVDGQTVLRGRQQVGLLIEVISGSTLLQQVLQAGYYAKVFADVLL